MRRNVNEKLYAKLAAPLGHISTLLESCLYVTTWFWLHCAGSQRYCLQYCRLHGQSGLKTQSTEHGRLTIWPSIAVLVAGSIITAKGLTSALLTNFIIDVTWNALVLYSIHIRHSFHRSRNMRLPHTIIHQVHLLRKRQKLNSSSGQTNNTVSRTIHCTKWFFFFKLWLFFTM